MSDKFELNEKEALAVKVLAENAVMQGWFSDGNIEDDLESAADTLQQQFDDGKGDLG